MLGVSSVIEEHHVVAAHTRVNADGTETFVPEHVRRNASRGSAPRLPAQQGCNVPEDHPGLFDAPAQPAAPPSQTAGPSLHLAVQLPLGLLLR